MVWLAALGLLRPAPAVAAMPRWWPFKGPVKPAAPAVIDVALAEDGTLDGLVQKKNGQPMAKTKVTVRRSLGVIGRATTDKLGRFKLSLREAGTYHIASPEGWKTLRIWDRKKAPAHAQASIVLVGNPVIIGGPASHCKLLAPDACIMAAIIAGAIAIPIAISDSRNLR